MKKTVKYLLLRSVCLFALFLMPSGVSAQVDDIYFVPTKKTKQSTEVQNAGSYSDSEDVGVEPENSSIEYTNNVDAYLYDNYYDDYSYNDEAGNDYNYSTRIVRFRTPRRALCSPIYWDLAYGCGINDWLVYDNGYSIDIYPTINNPMYAWNGYWGTLNYYNWYDCYRWNSWCYSPSWNWHAHNMWHSGYYYGYHNYWYPGYHYQGGWRPGYFADINVRRPTYIPSNGNSGNRRGTDAVANRGSGKDASVTANRNNNGVNLRGGNAERGSVEAVRKEGNRRNGNQRGFTLERTSSDSNEKSNVNLRTESQSGNTRSSSTVRDTSARRRQPAGSSVSGSGTQRRNEKSNVNSNSRRRNSSSSSSGESRSSVTEKRRESSSSSGYSRPSSTGVSRSYNSSSSRSSGSSIRSSSSSRSGGSRRGR